MTVFYTCDPTKNDLTSLIAARFHFTWLSGTITNLGNGTVTIVLLFNAPILSSGRGVPPNFWRNLESLLGSDDTLFGDFANFILIGSL